jgi:hypothetical protein
LHLGDLEGAGLLAEGVGAGVEVGAGVKPDVQSQTIVTISAKRFATN